jgi:hypothetical protein
MDIDSAKKQAKALIRALQALGVAHLDTATALETVARMHGFRNWSTAHAAGGIGPWNAAQAAAHGNWSGLKTNWPQPGEDYSRCEPLFVAVMDVAGQQPLARAIKTIEYWAKATDELYVAAADGTDFEALNALPVKLAAPFADALRAELVPDRDERIQRLQQTRDLLYEVALALRRLAPVGSEKVLLLDSRDGCDYMLAVGVPTGRSLKEASDIANQVCDSLIERSPNYCAAELLVRMAQQGFPPMDHAFGPVWDGEE